ncbi:MAG: type II secretion system protein GspE, partial [Actinobacteria bacterium]|nr:type II secretion system protein GspE [Actinomycetota bacterium]
MRDESPAQISHLEIDPLAEAHEAGGSAGVPIPEPAGEAWNGVTTPRSRTGTRFLKDVVVELELADPARVERASEEARTQGTTLEAALIGGGVITQEALSRAVAERHGLDHIDLSAFRVDMAAANLITSAQAKRYEAVPIAFSGDNALLLVMADPQNVLAIDEIAMLTGHDVRPAVAARDDIQSLVTRLTRLDEVVQSAALVDEQHEDAEVVELRDSADDAPLIKLINGIIAQGVERGASDIHLEPDGRDLRVRLRIDGVLQESATIPRRMVPGAISRVKIMSELDIAERRIPQDGRVGLQIDGKHIDLRVVTLPSVHGESVVIRILDQSGIVELDLEKLGFLEHDRETFSAAIARPYGAVLATGPTGSGKSTTLYTGVTMLNSIEKNIITIEDPVEYQIEGITQIQINPRAGLTFANGLRAMMRADPDIIMVGEIRDRETAQIAIESALTGHMVLSTLHTNDAPSAITRLIEMGIEPFLVSSAVSCVVAQRLARTLCPQCKAPTIITAAALRDHGFSSRIDIEAYEAVGCTRCSGTGYRGRIGLYEVMPITAEIRDLAIERASTDRIAEVAVHNGMRRLREDGLE